MPSEVELDNLLKKYGPAIFNLPPHLLANPQLETMLESQEKHPELACVTLEPSEYTLL